MEDGPFMEDLTIYMIIVHSYVKLPEGIQGIIQVVQIGTTKLQQPGWLV